MMKKPIVNTIIQILGKAIMVSLGLLTTGLLTRNLGSGQYGGYVLIVSSFIMLDAIADFGTKIIGIREMSAEDNKPGRVAVLSQLMWLRLLMVTTAYVLGWIVVWNWGIFAVVRTEALLALTMIWLTALGGVWEIVFQTEMRMDLKVLSDIVFPVLLVAGIWWWRNTLSLKMVFEISVLARVISLGVGLVLVSSLIDWGKVVTKIDTKRVKELWKLSWPMGVYLLLFASYDRGIDSMMISKFSGLKEVAWYGLAYKIYTTLLQPAYFFVTATFPLMAAKEVEKRKLFKNSLGLLLVGVVGLILTVEVMAPWIVSVLAGNEFGPAVTALRILMLASLFSYLSHLLGFTLIARGGQNEMLKLGILILCFNFLANWWMIPQYGIYAASWVTVATELLGTLGMGYFLWKNVKSQT